MGYQIRHSPGGGSCPSGTKNGCLVSEYGGGGSGITVTKPHPVRAKIPTSQKVEFLDLDPGQRMKRQGRRTLYALSTGSNMEGWHAKYDVFMNKILTQTSEVSSQLIRLSDLLA